MTCERLNKINFVQMHYTCMGYIWHQPMLTGQMNIMDVNYHIYWMWLNCFSHGAASGLDVTMEGSHSVTQSLTHSVMGHYTCERNNFSLTCPMVTKLGMYVRYGHPKNPIDFGVQRSRSLGSTSPHHNKLLNISPQRRGLVQCLCLFMRVVALSSPSLQLTSDQDTKQTEMLRL